MLCLVAAMLQLTQTPAVKANALFADNAILQRQKPVPVFGTGTPGTEVEIALDQESRKTKVGKDGRWIVKFPAKEAGGPHELKLNGSVIARNVLFGEVWIASGQSNMEWSANNANDYDEARRIAKPNIRMFTVTKTSVENPLEDVGGAGWVEGNADTVGGFSAVGFWFAEFLAQSTKVPVGVIHTSWGGTPAESWTSMEMLRKTPSYATRLAGYEENLKNDFPLRQAEYKKALAAYNEERRDKANEGEAKGWHLPTHNVGDWRKVAVPQTTGSIEGPGKPSNGAFWFRVEFDLPSVPGDMELSLGALDDFDHTYVNGKLVGKTGEETPNFFSYPRKYSVPASVLKPGRNLVAVRVYDWGGAGGFMSSAKELYIGGQGKKIPLAGTWSYKAERIADFSKIPQEPFGPGNPWAPASLYNGMIAPLVPYGIRGAIWYQGESNADRAFQYRSLFANMIRDWRKRFGQGEFPFYFVQLANFMGRPGQPSESNWAELREAQDMTLSLRNAGMATAIDIGEAQDIHPRNKKEVGRRLALIALNRVHKEKIEYSGPRFGKLTVLPGALKVQFKHAKGLRSRDGKSPQFFQIAAADRKYVWAEATIVGTSVVLKNAAVPNPVAVRYAWADNPEINLENGDGLPAVPFRTDTWPGLTDTRQ